MAAILIFDWDLKKAIPDRPGVRPVPPLPVQVFLEPDAAIRTMVMNDPLLHQQIINAIKAVFDTAASDIAKLAAASSALDASKARFDFLLKEKLESAQSQAASRAGLIVNQLRSQKAIYRNYQIKCGVKVGLGVLGLVAAGVGVAGAAVTGGVSLGVAIAASVRSILDGAKTLNNMCRDAETIGKRVTNALVYLALHHAPTSSRTIATIRAMGATILSSVIVLELNSKKNLPKVKGDCDLWKMKLFGIRLSAQQLAQELNLLLNQLENIPDPILRRRLENRVMGLLGEGPDAESRKKTGVGGVWARMRTKSSVAYESDRAAQGIRAQEQAAATLSELDKTSPNWVKYFDQFFPIAVSLGLGYSTSTVPDSVLDAVGVGLSVGTDVDSLLFEAAEAGEFLSLGEEIEALARGEEGSGQASNPFPHIRERRNAMAPGTARPILPGQGINPTPQTRERRNALAPVTPSPILDIKRH